MIRTPTFSPRSHEGGPFPSDVSHVDGEYVFTTVVETSPGGDLLQFSVRVDPDEGPPDELVLHVDRRFDRAVSRNSLRRDSVVVTVSAPGLGSPPRVDALESVLEDWCRRHWRDDLGPESGDESVQSVRARTGTDAVPAQHR